MSDTTFSVPMKILACSACGISYAIPSALNFYECPGCARRLRTGVQEDLDAAYAEAMHKDRQIAALKGVIARRRSTR